MNRRAFVKGLMATCAAVAAPLPRPVFASGGWIAGGIDLAGAGDMLAVAHMRATLPGAFEIISSEVHRFKSDGPQISSLLRRDAVTALIRSGERERICASRRAEDFERGAA